MIKTESIDIKSEIAWIYPSLGHLGDRNKVMAYYQ